MRKKIGLLLVLIFIVSITISLIFVTKMNIKEDIGSSMAIMIYDEAEGTYVKANEIPKGSYELNMSLSKCDSGGIIGEYDSVQGTIKYTLGTADQCNLYFDISALTLASYIRNVVYTEDGVNDLYLHDGQGTYTNANLEAGDNSYRYVGANPDNYVCFQGDDCTNEDNLYRIISVINDKVKLIKYTDINAGNTLTWNSTNANIWQDGNLDLYLNGEYLNNLLFKDKIDTTLWYAGGMPLTSVQSPNSVKNTYDLEISGEAIERKIGLMYVSDYGYASLPTYWSNDLYANFSGRVGNDWLLDTNKWQWTISSDTSYSDGAFGVDAGAGVYDFYGVSRTDGEMRPSFNLKSSVKVINAVDDGIGTKENPIIIS